MKEQKNIDRLFQEKFKDFEQAPKEEVWQNISKKLKEKQKKKPLILPIWYKLGGIAAILALLLGGFYFLQNNTINFTEPQITFEIEDENLPHFDLPTDSSLENATKTLEEFIENTESLTEENRIPTQKSNAVANGNISAKNEIINKSNSEKTTNNSLVTTPNQSKTEQQLVHNTEKETGQFNKKKLFENDTISSAPKNRNSKIAAVDSSKVTSEEEYENALAILEKEKNTEHNLENIYTNSEAGKLSISPFAAPVYYDNLGNGNPIDPTFAKNQTNSEVTMAYGLKIAYAVSEKVKIRSGINKVNMNYKTQNISYNYTYATTKLNNISYISGSENIRIDSNQPIERSFDSPMDPQDANNFALSNIPNEQGALNQNFGYIEVPLEVEYRLIDNKIGLKLIGGASSLFLDENSISVAAPNGNIELGESNNLEDLSFTTNIGMGVDYKLNDNFKLNFEPTFKYQLNSFNNTEGMKPFFIGLYTGFSYEF